MHTIDMRPIKAALREAPASEEHYRALCIAFADRSNDDLLPSGVVLGLAMLNADVAAGRVPPVSGLPAMAIRLLFMNLEDDIEARVTPDEWAAIEAFRKQVEENMMKGRA